MGSRAASLLHERIAADLTAPGSARRLLERRLRHLPADLLDRLKLLVTELVTNAVTHGSEWGTDIDLTVTQAAGVVRVDVTNEGPGFHHHVRRRSFRRSEWALYLVEKLSDRWGVLEQDRTHVWFEVGLGESPPPRRS